MYALMMLTTGILGGSWLLGSLLLNDWPSITELVYGNGGNLSSWMLDLDLIVPSSPSMTDSNNQEYWGSILASVESKANNGLYVSSWEHCASIVKLTSLPFQSY
jgi:lysophospholipase